MVQIIIAAQKVVTGICRQTGPHHWPALHAITALPLSCLGIVAALLGSASHIEKISPAPASSMTQAQRADKARDASQYRGLVGQQRAVALMLVNPPRGSLRDASNLYRKDAAVVSAKVVRFEAGWTSTRSYAALALTLSLLMAAMWTASAVAPAFVKTRARFQMGKTSRQNATLRVHY